MNNRGTAVQDKSMNYAKTPCQAAVLLFFELPSPFVLVGVSCFDFFALPFPSLAAFLADSLPFPSFTSFFADPLPREDFLRDFPACSVATEEEGPAAETSGAVSGFLLLSRKACRFCSLQQKQHSSISLVHLLGHSHTRSIKKFLYDATKQTTT